MASRGQLGGLSPAASRVVDAMDAAGKDVVIIETVGTGQSEVEVAEVADVKVVVLAPGLGDEVQAMKAGIIEIADLLVVNKADLPEAQAAVAPIKGSLGLRATKARRSRSLTLSLRRGDHALVVVAPHRLGTELARQCHDAR